MCEPIRLQEIFIPSSYPVLVMAQARLPAAVRENEPALIPPK